jgi:FtsH-binding integral membrane protein
MYIPNYIPEPDAIPRNVTREKYHLRLIFIRQVLSRFLLTIVFVTTIAEFAAEIHPSKTPYLIGGFFTFLVLASLERTFLRSNPQEARVAELLPWLLVLAYGALFATAHQANLPVWSALVGLGCFFGYANLCGRDFSFVGGFVLSLIASSVIIATIAVFEGNPPGRSALALGWNAAILLYVVYDLAALMSRRKVDEQWAAVADLYRDPLNFIGYAIRLVKHWRRHRILHDFAPENPFKEVGPK